MGGRVNLRQTSIRQIIPKNTQKNAIFNIVFAKICVEVCPFLVAKKHKLTVGDKMLSSFKFAVHFGQKIVDFEMKT